MNPRFDPQHDDNMMSDAELLAKPALDLVKLYLQERARAEAAEARAAELEKALDDLVMACELPGDHCELQPSLDRARAALSRKGEG